MSKEKAQPIINVAKQSPAYKQGKVAYENNIPRRKNPYEIRTYNYTEWDRGWFTNWQKGLIVIYGN